MPCRPNRVALRGVRGGIGAKPPLKPRKIPQNPPESPLKTPRFGGYPLTKPSSMGYNSKRLLGKPDNPSPSSRRMPLPRGASQAAVGAGCAGDWQKRRAKRGGTHAACAPVEGACERRSRVRCGADRSLGEWQRLWIGSNVGWGVVSCRRRFARWNPKRADPSARALFSLDMASRVSVRLWAVLATDWIAPSHLTSWHCRV
jgi:hypothetical protein